MTLELNGCPRKTIGHLFYTISSWVHNFIAISELKLKLQSGNARLGLKSVFLFCPVWPWNLTDDLENNRAPNLCCFKLCASFHHHMSIQTWVTARKRLNGVMTSVTLTFDIWPWPFALTSLLSLVITPENFMMIRWHVCLSVCLSVRPSVRLLHLFHRQIDRQTDGRLDRKKCS